MSTTEKLQQYLTTCDLRRTRQEDAAKSLDMSGSTLRRRLIAEGIQYYALVEAERMRRCELRMKQEPEIRGKHLMHDLGYTELNSFYRAYRRWTGENFVDYRNRKGPLPACQHCGGLGRVER